MNDSGKPISTAEKQRLRDLWSKVVSCCEQFGDRARAGNVELEAAEYTSFVDALRARVDHEALRKIVASWKYESAAQRLNRLAEQIEQLADRLERAPVSVECNPTTLRLPPKRWSPFWSAFTHVLRNSLDHGIEPAEEREAAGKPPGGRIKLCVEVVDNAVIVSIADDGRGISWATLADKARQSGLPAETEADLVEAMFSDGISSRDQVTETSGRGVGMGAVRATVRELGGRIELHTEAGKGSTFRFVLPRSMLEERAETTPPTAMLRGLVPKALAL
jgi:two-component system, chemotaxis family, sensor kinase CheA